MTSERLIVSQDGKVLQRSRDLAGIRRYVSNHRVQDITIRCFGVGLGRLSVMFESGAFFETDFQSYTVLLDFVKRWRNVDGATVYLINELGVQFNGTISKAFWEEAQA